MKRDVIVKEEYRRCLFSVATLVYIVAALASTFVNYYMTHMTKLELIQQLSDGAEDLNIEVLQAWIGNFNGVYYFFSYYNNSDEFTIGILLLYAWIGIFVSAVLCQQKLNGYGNWLVTRCGYKQYARAVIVARSCYVATVIAIVFLLQLAFAFVLGGAKTLTYTVSSAEYSAGFCLLMIVLTYVVVTFYSVVINIMATSCVCFARGSYVIQIIPMVVFAMVPLLVFSTLANVVPIPEFVINMLTPYEYMTKIHQLWNTFYLDDLLSLIVSIGLFAAVARGMMRISAQRMETDYL